jgi:hypothetical protein
MLPSHALIEFPDAATNRNAESAGASAVT